jgi:sugar lactone lactonase YvrE
MNAQSRVFPASSFAIGLALALFDVHFSHAIAQDFLFLSTNYQVGTYPYCVVATNLTGRSTLDLVSANEGDSTLTVLTNDGSGNFGSNATLNVGSAPYWVLAADLRGAGKLDLVSANLNDDTLTVLTNDGNGNFGYDTTLDVGSGPYDVVAADLRGTGKPDLITANYFDYTLTVLTNDGNGNFGLSATLDVDGGPCCVAAVDLRGVGKLDLVSANYDNSTVTVLTNDGRGNFGFNATYNVGSNPEWVLAADLRGTGKPDLVSANMSDNTLTVLTNDGSGNFGSNATLNVGGWPWVAIAADLTGAGRLDLVSANSGDVTLTVWTNDGSGNFGFATNVEVGINPACVAAADLSGKGKLALISANSSSYTLTVLSQDVPPTITEQPQGQFVLIGSNATFSVGATGAVPMACQWQSNGVNLTDGGFISGSQTDCLTISNAQPLDAGTYQVIVTNDFGSVTSSVVLLELLYLPIVAPANQVGVLAGQVVWSATDASTGPTSYQWQINGTDVPINPIQTAAGRGGNPDFSGDGGPATDAELAYPSGVAVDAVGSLFIADLYNQRVRKVDTNGIITTVAGNGNANYNGDGGPATNAALGFPTGVAVDALGNLFIADSYNCRIRKVDTNGFIATVAGNGNASYSGDGGQATNAALNDPEAVAVDASGNLFIADTGNYVIRKVDTNGIITTVAGNGLNGPFSGAGMATNTSLHYPSGLAVDAWGNLLVVDCGNNFVLKVDTNGAIEPLAGNGTNGFSGDGYVATCAELASPCGVVADSAGNVYIAENGNNRIRHTYLCQNGFIDTLAGNGNRSFSGDGGPAIDASLAGPEAVALDPTGQRLFIADCVNQRVREVFLQNSQTFVEPLQSLDQAGNYTVVASGPYGSVTSSVVTLTIAIPPSAIAEQAQEQTVLAGTNLTLGVVPCGTSPLACQWQFNGSNLSGATNASLSLTNVTTNSDGIYSVVVSSPYGCLTSTVARLTVAPEFAAPVITTQPANLSGDAGSSVSLSVTVTGTGPFRYQWQFNGTNLPPAIMTLAGGSVADGIAATASPVIPNGVTADACGNLFFADTGSERVRKVDTHGIITTVAGDGAVAYYGDGGPATNAAFNGLCGLAVDAGGNLYVADCNNSAIRKVDTNGIITTVAGCGEDGFFGDGDYATNAALAWPADVAVDALGNLFIADTGNQRIRQIDTNGIITTVAGNGYRGYPGDGSAATAAYLWNPVGVALDAIGNLFIADEGTHRIRKVDTNGIITTVAGNATDGFSGDGNYATNAAISYPSGVAVDTNGNLFIADYNNCRLRVVNSNGIISTLAGNGTNGYSGDGGRATNAMMTCPVGVTADGAGNVFTADQENFRLRKVNTNGMISTVAGNGATGWPGNGNAPLLARLNNPQAVALDSAGKLFLSDSANNLVRVLATNGSISTAAGTGDAAYFGDGGAATNASLNAPSGLALDAFGDLFIADTGNERIRMVGVNGMIETFAGNGTAGFFGDGITLGPFASLNNPSGVAVDSDGNVFIADTENHRIRKITPGGIISTVAGNGNAGPLGDGGQATNACLIWPCALTLDTDGSLLIVDDNVIRRVGTDGIINTVAGDGEYGYSGDGGRATNAEFASPSGIAVDNLGNIFIADADNQCLRMINANRIVSTIAGNGNLGFSGDGGPATNASLAEPWGVATDSNGNLFVADSVNNRIREVLLGGSPNLLVTNLAANNAGTYSVIVISPYGSVTNVIATVTVATSPPQILASGSSFGVIANQFGFYATATPGASIAVDASTNLVNWTPLCTNFVNGSGVCYFSDPDSTNFPWRFYRVRVP